LEGVGGSLRNFWIRRKDFNLKLDWETRLTTYYFQKGRVLDWRRLNQLLPKKGLGGHLKEEEGPLEEGHYHFPDF